MRELNVSEMVAVSGGMDPLAGTCLLTTVRQGDRIISQTISDCRSGGGGFGGGIPTFGGGGTQGGFQGPFGFGGGGPLIPVAGEGETDAPLTMEDILEAFDEEREITSIIDSFNELTPEDKQLILNSLDGVEAQFLLGAQDSRNAALAADLLQAAKQIGLIGDILGGAVVFSEFANNPTDLAEAGDAFAFVTSIFASAAVGAAVGGPLGAAAGFFTGVLIEAFGDEVFEAAVIGAGVLADFAVNEVQDFFDNQVTDFVQDNNIPSPTNEDGTPNNDFFGMFGGFQFPDFDFGDITIGR